jgi:hypothetical protein
MPTARMIVTDLVLAGDDSAEVAAFCVASTTGFG